MKKQLNPFVALVLCAIMAGCSSTPVAPGNDPLVVNAERNLTAGHTTIDFLFTIERENEALVIQHAPAVHNAVNALRRKAPQVEKTAWAAVDAYKGNRDATNGANLNTWMAVFLKMLDEAQGYIGKVQALPGAKQQ